MGVFEQCVIFQRGINVGFVEGLWGNDLAWYGGISSAIIALYCRDSTDRTMDVKQQKRPMV